MKKNNNGIKGAILSLSVVATVGGWVALGSSQDQQGGFAPETAEADSKATEAVEQADDVIPIPRAVPVSTLLDQDDGDQGDAVEDGEEEQVDVDDADKEIDNDDGGDDDEEEQSDEVDDGEEIDNDDVGDYDEEEQDDLPPIPRVVPAEHRLQTATHPVAPLPTPPSALWSSEWVVQTLPESQIDLMQAPSQASIEIPEPSSNVLAIVVPKKELPPLELAPLPDVSSVLKEPQSKEPLLATLAPLPAATTVTASSLDLLPAATTVELPPLAPLPTISPLQKPQISMAALSPLPTLNSGGKAKREIRQLPSLPELPSSPQSSVKITTLELKPITTISPPQQQPAVITRSSQ